MTSDFWLNVLNVTVTQILLSSSKECWFLFQGTVELLADHLELA